MEEELEISLYDTLCGTHPTPRVARVTAQRWLNKYTIPLNGLSATLEILDLFAKCSGYDLNVTFDDVNDMDNYSKIIKRNMILGHYKMIFQIPHLKGNLLAFNEYIFRNITSEIFFDCDFIPKVVSFLTAMSLSDCKMKEATAAYLSSILLIFVNTSKRKFANAMVCQVTNSVYEEPLKYIDTICEQFLINMKKGPLFEFSVLPVTEIFSCIMKEFTEEYYRNTLALQIFDDILAVNNCASLKEILSCFHDILEDRSINTDEIRKTFLINYLMQPNILRHLKILVRDTRVSITCCTLKLINQMQNFYAPSIFDKETTEHIYCYLYNEKSEVLRHSAGIFFFLTNGGSKTTTSYEFIKSLCEFHYLKIGNFDKIQNLLLVCASVKNKKIWNFKEIFKFVLDSYAEKKFQSASIAVKLVFYICLENNYNRHNYDPNIMELLSIIPDVLEELKKDICLFGMLLDILLAIDMYLYNTGYIKNDKHLIKILNKLEYGSLRFRNYQLLSSINNLLDKIFNECGLVEAENIIKRLHNGLYRKMMNTKKYYDKKNDIKKFNSYIYRSDILQRVCCAFQYHEFDKFLTKNELEDIENIVKLYIFNENVSLTFDKEGYLIGIYKSIIFSKFISYSKSQISKDVHDTYANEVYEIVYYCLKKLDQQRMSIFLCMQYFCFLCQLFTVFQPKKYPENSKGIKLVLKMDVGVFKKMGKFANLCVFYRKIDPDNFQTQYIDVEYKKLILKGWNSLQHLNRQLPILPTANKLLGQLTTANYFHTELKELFCILLKYEVSNNYKFLRLYTTIACIIHIFRKSTKSENLIKDIIGTTVNLMRIARMTTEDLLYVLTGVMCELLRLIGIHIMERAKNPQKQTFNETLILKYFIPFEPDMEVYNFDQIIKTGLKCINIQLLTEDEKKYFDYFLIQCNTLRHRQFGLYLGPIAEIENLNDQQAANIEEQQANIEEQEANIEEQEANNEEQEFVENMIQVEYENY